jgi:hypothetical protein
MAHFQFFLLGPGAYLYRKEVRIMNENVIDLAKYIHRCATNLKDVAQLESCQPFVPVWLGQIQEMCKLLRKELNKM